MKKAAQIKLFYCVHCLLVAFFQNGNGLPLHKPGSITIVHSGFMCFRTHSCWVNNNNSTPYLLQPNMIDSTVQVASRS